MYLYTGERFESFDYVGKYIVVKDYKTHYVVNQKIALHKSVFYLPKNDLGKYIISQLKENPYVRIGHRNYVYIGSGLKYKYDDGISFISAEIKFEEVTGNTRIRTDLLIGFVEENGSVRTKATSFIINTKGKTIGELSNELDTKIDESIKEMINQYHPIYFVTKNYDYPHPSMKSGMKFQVENTIYVYDDVVVYRKDYSETEVYMKKAKINKPEDLEKIDLKAPDKYWYGGSIIGFPEDYDRWQQIFREIFGTSIEISSGILGKNYFMGNVISMSKHGSTTTFVVVKDGKITTSPVIVRIKDKYYIAVFRRKKISKRVTPSAKIPLSENSKVSSSYESNISVGNINNTIISNDGATVTLQYVDTIPINMILKAGALSRSVELKITGLAKQLEEANFVLEYGVVS